ncbi:MAG: ABC transporter substrate-binding protein [Alphaproteobacteria bacterium]|jgi:PAS domain S-box-containing protein|nr:ABC transporter substrate-binding protein [Alphaproteobacteria bacterium]
MGGRVSRLARAGCAVFALLLSALPAVAQDRLVVQLRWDHQFQFAGLYAAQWQGYYRDAGLDVALRSVFDEDGSLLSAVREVAEGRAQVGIGAADILLENDRGADLVVLASIFQHSGASFFARADTDLGSLSALTRLRVARRPGDLIDIEFQAMLQAEGIDPDRVPPAPFNVGDGYLADLAAGRVDVMPGYSIGTPYVAARRELALTSLSPRTYGIDFYGDSLFTTRDFAEANPDLMARFLAATLEGWAYALDHPEEMADRIAERFTPAFPIDDYRAFNHFQIEPVGELIDPFGRAVEIGHVNPQRWRRMHDLLAAAGLVDGGFDPARFVFDPAAFRSEQAARWVRWLLAGGGMLAALVAILGGWSWALRRSVARATRSLRENQAQLQALNEASPEAMLILERDGTCVQLNGRAAARLGRTVEECIGRNPFDWMAAKVAAGRRAKLQEALDTGRPVCHFDERDGYSLEHIIVPVANPCGPADRAAVYPRDVTEWRRHEQELRQASLEAEQANRAKSQFIAVMAHEMRTPLNAINGFAQMMEMRVFGPLGDPHYDEYARDIRSSGEHLLSLINDLLDLSKIEAGRMQIEFETVDLAAAVGAVLALVRERAAAKHLQLSSDIAPAAATLTADSRALKQMLINLLSNAIKFTPDQGRITVAARRLEDGGLELAVRDTGVGIAPDDLAAVLEPFHQGRAGRHSGEPGTGLGLTLVKSLVDLHGGRLNLAGAPGGGTEARLLFPPDAALGAQAPDQIAGAAD